jgi:hypothetical protein
MIMAVSYNGEISAFAPSGEVLQRWQPAENAGSDAMREPNVSLGPSFGGGAIWFSDDRGVLYRLGPPLTTP